MSSGRSRVQALVAAAARCADPADELGRKARQELAISSGLSPASIGWALAECLETAPSLAELDALCASVTRARAVHVILPANVFVATHRAIALGLAASASVFVRPSRREPHFARLLAQATPGLFAIVPEISPQPGDVVWAYGGETSLAAVQAKLPTGALLHAQGPGFGFAIIEAAHASLGAAAALALDIAAFDQRGCLSPRGAVVVGDRPDALAFAALVAHALGELAERMPLGRLDDDERAEITRFRSAGAYAGTLLGAGPGWVLVPEDARAGTAPIGRNLHVSAAPSLDAALGRLDPTLITTLGVAGAESLAHATASALPRARVVPLGRMQRPAFDGPADRRGSELTKR